MTTCVCVALQMSTAKETLTGHSQLLRCLEKVDEERRFQNLLMTGRPGPYMLHSTIRTALHYMYCTPLYVLHSAIRTALRYTYCTPLYVLHSAIRTVLHYMYCTPLYVLHSAIRTALRYTYCTPLYVLHSAIRTVLHYMYCTPLYVLHSAIRTALRYTYCTPLYVLYSTTYVYVLPIDRWCMVGWTRSGGVSLLHSAVVLGSGQGPEHCYWRADHSGLQRADAL